MEAVSMTTKSLRDILRKAADPDCGCINMRIASEIHRTGGGVFLAARKMAASERQTESNIVPSDTDINSVRQFAPRFSTTHPKNRIK